MLMTLLAVSTGITSLLSGIALVWALITERDSWWVYALSVGLLAVWSMHALSLKSLDSAPMERVTRALFCTPQQQERLRLLGTSVSRRTSCNPSPEPAYERLDGPVMVVYEKTDEGGTIVPAVVPISQ